MKTHPSVRSIIDNQRFREIAFVVAVMTVTAWIRWLGISARLLPTGDEIHYLLFARDLSQGIGVTMGTYWSPGWPLVIAVGAFFLQDVECAARILAVACGVVHLPFVYCAARLLFDRRSACLSILLMAGAYPFFMLGTSLYSENCFALFVTAVFISGWQALNYQRKRLWFLTGALVGVSYLVRTEGLLWAGFFAVALMVSSRRRTVARMGCFGAGLFLIVLPLLFWHHNAFRNWIPGARVTRNLHLFSAERLAIKYEGRARVLRQSEELCTQLGASSEEALRYHNVHTSSSGYFLRNAKRIEEQTSRGVFIVPVFRRGLFFLLVFIGGWTAVRKGRGRAVGYVAGFFLYACLFLLFVYFQPRYLFPYLPAPVILCGAGLRTIWGVLEEKTPQARRIVAICAGAYYLIGFCYVGEQIGRANVSDYDRVMQVAGRWMREYLAPGWVVSEQNSIPYYFYRTGPLFFDRLPVCSPAGLGEYLRERNVRYLEVSSLTRRDNPVVALLFAGSCQESVHLLRVFRRGTAEVRIYENNAYAAATLTVTGLEQRPTGCEITVEATNTGPLTWVPMTAVPARAGELPLSAECHVYRRGQEHPLLGVVRSVSAPVLPGAVWRLSFSLPSRDVPPGNYRGVIDLKAHDPFFWFSQTRAVVPVILSVRRDASGTASVSTVTVRAPKGKGLDRGQDSLL